MLAIGVGGADAVDAMTGTPWELKAPRILGMMRLVWVVVDARCQVRAVGIGRKTAELFHEHPRDWTIYIDFNEYHSLSNGASERNIIIVTYLA